MRTQIFKVDYLHMIRDGGSRTLVSSGQIGQNSASGSSGNTNTTTSGSKGGGGEKDLGYVSGSVVETTSRSDFWNDLRESLNLIVGTEQGRKVVVHPQTGIIVVNAMPQELRDVDDFLKTIEDTAHRLVIIEAKIIEVTLNDKFQAGINWNALLKFGDDKSILFGHNGGGTVFEEGHSGLAGDLIPIGEAARTALFPTPALGGIFTVNADLKDFNALIELLKLQGDVQVLSSPRISTVNNQKAIIKVGQDEYFVTDVESDIETGSGISNNVQSIDVTLTPFFSGIALDVIPQISDDDSIILHIHPAISEVREEVKEISVTTEEELSIPLALSTIRETDSVIRAKSGQVVILGGLMKDVLRDAESRTPVLGDIPGIGNMFRHKREITAKSELVILLRPMVINNPREWNGQLRETADRFQNLRSDNTVPR
jgi:MSHA biogenesis protein MshL